MGQGGDVESFRVWVHCPSGKLSARMISKSGSRANPRKGVNSLYHKALISHILVKGIKHLDGGGGS